MKFAMIVILVGLCSYVGYGFSKYYTSRNEFYKELVLFLSKVNLSINFSKEKLKSIILAYENKSKELSNILQNFVLCLENNKLKEDTLFLNVKLLDQEEKNVLFKFFSSLGHFDLENQTKQIESFSKIFENRQKNAEQEKNKYAPLFTKLGLIVGVIISLILL